MSTIELEAKRMRIFRQLLNIEDEALLQKVENLLYEEDLPVMEGYSKKALKDAILCSKGDIRSGHIYTQEQMRERHPRV
jgi:hypothetical protein